MERPIAQKLSAVRGSFDLTPSQWKALDFMEKSGTCTLVEIARHLSTKKPSVTRMIFCLEEKQLVEQVPGRDKREKRIQMTGRGKEVYAACRKALDEVERHLLSGISDEEQGMLLRALITIRDNYRQR
jgi:MarR family transcriptional regulator, transcriptional regulator for hemolysin